ncbi:MAG: prepilin-type N-terminal cleavage/methylation domain-containing protein [Rickettsiales bacterium]|nr:prepilin-type N-terminal cleavage/methylation domain-containing protein [Rickettsiales bacterium]
MKQGFTLLELSIVLVIIGGITVGQEMIRASELNSVISDVNKYKLAVNTFKLKYNALPGDMDNAHDYWDNGADGICGTAGECNGDGDGLIENAGGLTSNEVGRVWQHLSLSEIIAGSYTGVITFPPVLDVSHPKSSIIGAGYSLEAQNNKNTLFFAAPVSSQGRPRAGALAALAAEIIDRKTDDGIPHQGKTTTTDEVHLIGGGAGNNCLISSDTVYNSTNSDIDCVMMFEIGL